MSDLDLNIRKNTMNIRFKKGLGSVQKKRAIQHLKDCVGQFSFQELKNCVDGEKTLRIDMKGSAIEFYVSRIGHLIAEINNLGGEIYGEPNQWTKYILEFEQILFQAELAGDHQVARVLRQSIKKGNPFHYANFS